MGCPKKSFGVILNQWVEKYCHSTKDTTNFQPEVKHPTQDHVLKNLATQLGLSQAPQAIPSLNSILLCKQAVPECRSGVKPSMVSCLTAKFESFLSHLTLSFMFGKLPDADGFTPDRQI
jgi:hypothetical protein